MPANREEYPLNLYFTVNFVNPKYGMDHKFLSVDGLSVQLTPKLAPKNIFRPNMNRRTVLRPKFKELVLKRAYRPNSNLLEWCMDAMNNHKREEENLTVTLLNSRRDMISAWRIEKAMPIGWHIDELHAEDSKILMETITLTYDYFEVVNSLGKVVAPKEK